MRERSLLLSLALVYHQEIQSLEALKEKQVCPTSPIAHLPIGQRLFVIDWIVTKQYSEKALNLSRHYTCPFIPCTFNSKDLVGFLEHCVVCESFGRGCYDCPKHQAEESFVDILSRTRVYNEAITRTREKVVSVLRRGRSKNKLAISTAAFPYSRSTANRRSIVSSLSSLWRRLSIASSCRIPCYRSRKERIVHLSTPQELETNQAHLAELPVSPNKVMDPYFDQTHDAFELGPCQSHELHASSQERYAELSGGEVAVEVDATSESTQQDLFSPIDHDAKLDEDVNHSLYRISSTSRFHDDFSTNPPPRSAYNSHSGLHMSPNMTISTDSNSTPRVQYGSPISVSPESGIVPGSCPSTPHTNGTALGVLFSPSYTARNAPQPFPYTVKNVPDVLPSLTTPETSGPVHSTPFTAWDASGSPSSVPSRVSPDDAGYWSGSLPPEALNVPLLTECPPGAFPFRPSDFVRGIGSSYGSCHPTRFADENANEPFPPALPTTESVPSQSIPRSHHAPLRGRTTDTFPLLDSFSTTKYQDAPQAGQTPSAATSTSPIPIITSPTYHYQDPAGSCIYTPKNPVTHEYRTSHGQRAAKDTPEYTTSPGLDIPKHAVASGFKCTCGKDFKGEDKARRANLFRHVKEQTSAIWHKCKKCHHRTKRGWNLSSHVRKVHASKS